MPPLSGIARYVQEVCVKMNIPSVLQPFSLMCFTDFWSLCYKPPQFEKNSPPERIVGKTTKEIHDEKNAAKIQNNKEALKEKTKECSLDLLRPSTCLCSAISPRQLLEPLIFCGVAVNISVLSIVVLQGNPKILSKELLIRLEHFSLQEYLSTLPSANWSRSIRVLVPSLNAS